MPIFPKSSTYRKLFPIHDSEEKVLRFRLGQENGKGKVTDMEMISREHRPISPTEVIASSCVSINAFIFFYSPRPSFLLY